MGSDSGAVYGASHPNPAFLYATAAGNVVQGLGAYVGASKRRQHEKKMAAMQQQHNIDMWKMKADYNHPKQQMQRLKKAGLNPNLVYGEGTGTTGQMSTMPQDVPPNLGQHQMETISQHVPDLIELFTRMYAMNTERVKATDIVEGTQKTRDERQRIAAQTRGQNLENAIVAAARKDLIKQLRYQMELTGNRAYRERIKAEIDQVEYQMTKELRKYGATHGDHWIGRGIIMLLKSLGVNPVDFIPNQ